MHAERVWSWAETVDEVEQRRAHASRLVGLELASVRYVDIDYRRHVNAPGARGPRTIVDSREWEEPTWKYPDCDSIDYGVELTTACNRVFSVTWDPPGPREGLGIQESSFLASAVLPGADVAIWDVGHESGWVHLVGQQTSAVRLHYLPWDAAPAGYWCPRITLTFGPRHVELLLGQGRPDQAVGPAADNVTVLFDPVTVPEWVQSG
jgi:hypothetical protein